MVLNDYTVWLKEFDSQWAAEVETRVIDIRKAFGRDYHPFSNQISVGWRNHHTPMLNNHALFLAGPLHQRTPVWE